MCHSDSMANRLFRSNIQQGRRKSVRIDYPERARTMTNINHKSNAAVRIDRQESGVIRIHASNLSELHWGMGYCHAMDRGLQMLLTRTLGQGRACECLSDTDEMLAIDRFFRRMNWSANVQSQLAEMDGDTRGLVQRYCDGVNAFFERKVPWELRILGFQYESWTPSDVILMTRMIGYINLAQSQGDLERLFVEMVQAGVDDARIEALFPGSLQEVDRSLLERVVLGERVVKHPEAWGVLPRAMASNNWVVHGSRTASGKPMMANDPHLEVNRLPSVWCEQILSTPHISVVTATMPGLPGALIGRSRDLAWGATYTFMDAVDSWMEECKDGCYRRGDALLPFGQRQEVIKRKKNPDETIVFYENEHGVLDGDPRHEGVYLATRWSSAESGAQSLIAAKEMWSARTVEQGMSAAGKIETAWNWVFGDSSGDIGYQMSGLMPVRHPNWSGFVPAPGWDPAYDWKGFVSPDRLPRCINPACGYLVTANQDLNHLSDLEPINSPMGAYRANRIEERLATSEEVGLPLCQSLQNDVFSLHAEEVCDFLSTHLASEDNPLRDWDFTYGEDSVEATLFEAIYRELRRVVLGDGGLGTRTVETLLDETGIFTDFYEQFDRVLFDTDSAWWDGLDPGTVVTNAVAEAKKKSHMPWGKANAIIMRHILFGGIMPSFLGFDRGPFPLKGGRATPNQGQLYSSGGRQTCFAPSVRIITDLANDRVYTALAGGATDRRFSKHYVSDLKRWLAGEYKCLSLPS